jgi:hypothetical protein
MAALTAAKLGPDRKTGKGAIMFVARIYLPVQHGRFVEDT